MEDDFEVAAAHVVYDRQDARVAEMVRSAQGNVILSGHATHIDAMITAAGLRAERHYDLSDEGRKCDVEDHRACEIKVAVGMAADISQTANVPLTPRLQRIWDEQTASDTELRQAIDEWAPSIPAEFKEEAEGTVWIVHNPAEAMKG